MKFLCKIKHRWDETHTVLTKYSPQISSIRPRFGNLMGFETFGMTRICKRCDEAQVLDICPFGTLTWLPVKEAIEKYNRYKIKEEKRTKK